MFRLAIAGQDTDTRLFQWLGQLAVARRNFAKTGGCYAPPAAQRQDGGVEKRQRLIIDQIPALRRYARALTGERHAADELVQDSLERAWSRFHLWRPGTDVRAWLFTIMHNLYANAVRKAKRTPSYAPLAEVDRVSPIPSNAEASVEVSNLIQALASLPDGQRETLLLVSLEGLTYEQVAQALDIPIGTVMSRLSRAREHLRQVMSGVGGKDAKRAT